MVFRQQSRQFLEELFEGFSLSLPRLSSQDSQFHGEYKDVEQILRKNKNTNIYEVLST